MVGFGLDYACAHIIILAEISSENLLPIRADFVTERDIDPQATPQFHPARSVPYALREKVELQHLESDGTIEPVDIP